MTDMDPATPQTLDEALRLPSLADAQRSLTRDRIVKAARAMLAERGLSVTVEEIASAAGVSSRTVFRHFSNHGQLIAEALDQLYRDIWEQEVRELPDPRVDLEAYLLALTTLSHTRNAEMLGRAFWDLLSPRPDTPPVVADGLNSRLRQRRKWMTVIVSRAWDCAGGTGEPPPVLVEAFWLHFSAFTTFSYASDFNYSPEQTARASTGQLMALLEAYARQAPGSGRELPGT
jgi:AcrR family transcriptional regulator